MDQLEALCRAVLRRLRERQPSLLPDQAAVTQLTCVLDMRQPSHHLLQPTKSVEAEMAIPGMPQARLLRVPCSQANGLLHLQVEQVQLVSGPFHLGKKPLLPVPDPEDVVLDQYLAAALIQLANANDT